MNVVLIPPKPMPPRNVTVPPATGRVGRGLMVGRMFAFMGMAIGWMCSRWRRRVHDDTLLVLKQEWAAQARRECEEAYRRGGPRPLPPEGRMRYETFYR